MNTHRVNRMCAHTSKDAYNIGLMLCVALQEAWNNFKDLKVKSLLPLGYNSWKMFLLREIHQSHNE
jgi:hypothetical protein